MNKLSEKVENIIINLWECKNYIAATDIACAAHTALSTYSNISDREFVLMLNEVEHKCEGAELGDIVAWWRRAELEKQVLVER